MKAFCVLLLSSFASVSAFAYQDGVYHCENSKGLPENVYKIKTLSMGAGAVHVPYVEVTRYFRSANEDGSVAETKIQGMASVGRHSDGLERLQLAALTLEFENDQLLGCRRVTDR